MEQEAVMKITVDIDCTPAEARQLTGLPDVADARRAVVGEMKKRIPAAAGQGAKKE
jgi:hypothetical protein